MTGLRERLRESHPNIVYPGNTVLRNPDGPEAANLIDELYGALEGALKVIEGDGITYPRKWDSALAKARGDA